MYYLISKNLMNGKAKTYACNKLDYLVDKVSEIGKAHECYIVTYEGLNIKPVYYFKYVW